MDISTEELFNRYAEETDILNNKKSLAVIIFGSRTTDAYKNSSDLDIFVITPGKDFYLKHDKRFIDGVPVATLLMSKETLKKKILSSFRIGSALYKSIFSDGVVKKNANNIVEEMRGFVEELSLKKQKRIEDLKDGWREYLDRELYKYREASGNWKKLYYYQFINYLRIIYTYMNDLSDITEWKCFDVYTKKEKAAKYKLDLPLQDFIDFYISALNPTDMEKSMKSLFHFVNYKDYLENKRLVDIPIEYRKCLSKCDTEKELMNLGENVYKVEDKLLSDTEDSNFVYFQLLSYMKEKYLRIGPRYENNFEEQFQVALDTVGSEERIRVIEELFHTITASYEFDYDDYSL